MEIAHRRCVILTFFKLEKFGLYETSSVCNDLTEILEFVENKFLDSLKSTI